MGKPVIELIDVNKNYNDRDVAMNKTSLEINKNEFVYIIGKSGSGKSSLIKSLYKEIDVDAGYLRVLDFDVANLHKKEIYKLRKRLGLVFQDFRLLENRTVFENVAFVLEATGHSKEEIENRVMECLSLVGLEKQHYKFPRELSGGQQQRVGIARAIANKPDIIIADEPNANIDPEVSIEIMELFEKIWLAGEGTTIIMATHDKSIVNTFQHRVVTIEDGKIIRDQEYGKYDLDDY